MNAELDTLFDQLICNSIDAEHCRNERCHQHSTAVASVLTTSDAQRMIAPMCVTETQGNGITITNELLDKILESIPVGTTEFLARITCPSNFASDASSSAALHATPFNADITATPISTAAGYPTSTSSPSLSSNCLFSSSDVSSSPSLPSSAANSWSVSSSSSSSIHPVIPCYYTPDSCLNDPTSCLLPDCVPDERLMTDCMMHLPTLHDSDLSWLLAANPSDMLSSFPTCESLLHCHHEHGSTHSHGHSRHSHSFDGNHGHSRSTSGLYSMMSGLGHHHDDNDDDDDDDYGRSPTLSSSSHCKPSSTISSAHLHFHHHHSIEQSPAATHCDCPEPNKRHTSENCRLVPWTPEEDERLMNQVRAVGCNYKAIAAAFPRRTVIACKRRLYYLRRKQRLPTDLQDAVKSTPSRELDCQHMVGVTFVPQQQQQQQQSGSSTSKSDGGASDMVAGAWVAKCSMCGRSVKKSYSVRVHGYEGARQRAMDARKEMMEEKRLLEGQVKMRGSI